MKRLQIISLFLLTSFLWSAGLYAQTLEKDSLALVALYKSTDGDRWTYHTNWLTNRPLSDWYGITVSRNRVTSIELSDNNLSGTIPVELWSMNGLNYLFLDGNNISGELPADISGLENITRIGLSENNLSGKIPEEIGSLTHLVFLWLGINHFQGELPASLGRLSNLTQLKVQNNNLEGYIPAEIAELTNLDILDLSDNFFSGAVPREFNRLENLRLCYLDNNLLQDLPDLSGMTNISTFYVQNNRLTFEDLETNSQTFGSSFSYLFQDSVGDVVFTTIEEGDSYTMSVSVGGTANYYQWFKNDTLINGATDSVYSIASAAVEDGGTYICRIRNTIATALTLYSRPIHVSVISALAQDSLALVALYDSTNGDNWTHKDNWLTDQPVSTWYGVKVINGRVQEIELTSNNLEGPLPNELGKMTELTKFNFANNKLSGHLPDSLVNLVHLRFMGLQKNRMSGEIPAWIDQLTSLTLLVLAQNNFSGEIPASIANLSHLWSLALWQNQLSGSIPESLGDLPSVERLSLGYNQLNGPIPQSLGKLSGVTELSLAHNNLTGEIPDTLKNLIKLTSLNLSGNNFTGPLPEWLGSFTDLYRLSLNNNDFYGEVPDTLKNLSKLNYLDVSDNHFDDLPDLSALSPTLTYFYVQRNQLTFEDIEPNMVFTNLQYSPQEKVGEEMDSTVVEGDSITLIVEVGGSANHYQWYKDGSELPGDTLSVYKISSAALSDSGSYTCQITNDIVSGLTLESQPFVVHVKSSTGLQDNRSRVLPQKYVLRQNYPNPFNPSTRIVFELPQAADVTINLYNVLGQKVAVLLNEHKAAGYHSVNFNAAHLSAGIYYYEINAGHFHQFKKMTLIK